MQTIETTAHVGPDGILRVEAPVAVKDKDVSVVITLRLAKRTTGRNERKKEASVKRKNAKREPALGDLRSWPRWKPSPYVPLALPGPSASDMLVSDRR
jgi:hypothetical protein